MHYFKRNIGDYAKKAGRLSMLQHGAYTLLIDACYDREQFPTMEEAIEWTWASTTEEEEAVRFVLRKFFDLEDGRYVQNRIREEIAEYHGKAKTNKRIAIEREAKRKENGTKRAPGVDEPPPNHKPLTNNQEPDTPPTPAGGSGEGGTEPPGDGKPPKGDRPVDEEFNRAWELYPKRDGGNPRHEAFKAWNARRREGVDPEVMIAGVERYAAHMKGRGKIGTQYVMQASTFFGPSQRFLEAWPATAPKGQQQGSNFNFADAQYGPSSVPPGMEGRMAELIEADDVEL